MEKPKGTLFVSIPSLLDPSLAPPGTHIFHAFTPDWIEAYQVLYSLAWNIATYVAFVWLLTVLHSSHINGIPVKLELGGWT